MRTVHQYEDGSQEALYLLVTRVEDDMLTGIVQDTYRNLSWLVALVPNGSGLTIPLNQVSEIPVDWQPEGTEQMLEELIVPGGRFVTGVPLV